MPRITIPAEERLLTPAEVAGMLRVKPTTLVRWNAAGKIRCAKTIGGHRRFFETDIIAILMGGEPLPSGPAEPERCATCGYLTARCQGHGAAA